MLRASRMHTPDWFRLFPAAAHRLAMNLRPGNAVAFWQDSPEAATVLKERARWLAAHPERHLLVADDSMEAVGEAVDWIMRALDRTAVSPATAATTLEPDWLVLSGDAASGHPVLGGAVIFPSGWALEEKIGRPLHTVHEPVPGLRQSLEHSIDTFLSRLAPQAAWERDNWGLAADDRLNHHPALPLPRLGPDATLHTTWLRLERQFLTRLPASSAILFGIRVTNHRLDDLARVPGLAPRLQNALATMDEALASYKGITTARAALVEQISRFV